MIGRKNEEQMKEAETEKRLVCGCGTWNLDVDVLREERPADSSGETEDGDFRCVLHDVLSCSYEVCNKKKKSQ